MAVMLVCWGAAAQNHSVLSSGRWWKLSVQEEGVYSITTRDIAALQGVAVDSLGVYGRSGAMLSTNNSITPTTDMHPLCIDVVDRNGDGFFGSDDELLFFGEGAEGWSYDTELKRWVYSHHAYANENCYYLTINAPRTVRIATAPTIDARHLPPAHYRLRPHRLHFRPVALLFRQRSSRDKRQQLLLHTEFQSF